MQKYSNSEGQVEGSFSDPTYPWNISWVNDPPREEGP
jgi:hypothetical protein